MKKIKNIKKLILILIGFFISITTFAGDVYRVNVLNEITELQAQNYPKQWEISTYKHSNPYGQTTIRYFIFAQSIKHNSNIVLTRAKKPGCPWTVSINGYTYYADFSDNHELQVGDSGKLKYNGYRLYFHKE